ncbi:C2H2-type zinc finger-containing protein [Heterostelium album PN500]|uniref:C2H2-type zinc finger-containing protein n=1 Tax=Heterostelium pallidum (strain ATCC 26659 / Pp 5 / PN500) TaxID=670386 RepID=D3B3Z8_HETP5|nr:C2H2-type zinc finger-containing protein [Heterostelium album PN500]EFA84046.1 C2H2-type zinc finger-containing protein [Heterostelium album PN500]|eukprot:XP_020436163.1 C2H2-type zinc finger-containing protein [Heterostelium album PN500]
MEKVGETFTCISCRVMFDNPEDQRVHYKSELHRFNLKRKVLDLPPVTLQTFNSKLEALKVEEKTQKDPTVYECRICDKQFSSEGPYNQHLISKKHKLNVEAGVPEKIRVRKPKEEKVPEKVPETLEEAEKMVEEKIKNTPKLPLEHCLFCRHVSATLDENVDHMAKQHSFFIPDIDFLVDLPGLLRYMSDKIAVGNICLYCSGKGRALHSLEAVQRHMIDLSHCKMNYDTEENSDEYIEFYDFTNSYKDRSNPDDELKDNLVITEGEMILPDGTVIGHRDYAVYYKQHYQVANVRQSSIAKIINQYKTLGWHEVTRSTQEIDQKIRHRQNVMALKVGMKKNNQRHHRLQLLIN